MGTFEVASLEHTNPPNCWILAPDMAKGKAFSSFSPSPAMPFGGSSGLMQKPHLGWGALQQTLKQEAFSSLSEFSPPISSFPLFPEVHASAAMLPLFGQISSWSSGGTDPFCAGNNSEPKTSGKRDLPRLASNGNLPVPCCSSGEFINVSRMTPKEIMDAKALAASKSHSEAERRRRQRINTHMAKLRSLLPSTTKTDKASLLAEVVHHVRELKRQAAEIAKISPIPTDFDELNVDIGSSSGEDKALVKASLCCDDRSGLLSDITKSLKDLELQIVKCEIATLSGRVKIAMLICRMDHAPCKQEGSSLTSVREALKAVMEKSASNELAPYSFFNNKGQRISYHCS